jgi:VIT1/CCC1 family predicted Fe2+/Mn2+ transporter
LVAGVAGLVAGAMSMAVGEYVSVRTRSCKDLAEQKDLHLRLAADFENFKRRSRQESEARAAAQKESFIVELLPVIDNLERALASGCIAGSPRSFIRVWR